MGPKKPCMKTGSPGTYSGPRYVSTGPSEKSGGTHKNYHFSFKVFLLGLGVEYSAKLYLAATFLMSLSPPCGNI